MSLCITCGQLLHSSSSAQRCPECRLRAWPGVLVLLDTYLKELMERVYIPHNNFLGWADQVHRALEAWDAYLIAAASVRRLAVATVIEAQQAAQKAWEANRLGGQRYTVLSSGIDPLVECKVAFIKAIDHRRLYRRYLRQCFRFDPRRGVWLPGKHPPQNGPEAACFTQGIHLYDFFTRMFLAGVDAVDSTQCDDPALFRRVADAMRGVLLGELPDIFARGLHSPYAFEVEGAALSMAGKVRPGIRIYPSVRKALGESGEPRTVLLGRLPAYVLEVHQTGARGVSELLQGVRRRVDQTRQTLAKRPLHHLPEPMLEKLEGQRHETQHAASELEEWYAKQEYLQRLDEIIPRAGLSRRQAQVQELIRAGLSHSDISSQLGIALGSVKQHTFRAYRKLRKAAGS